MEWSWIVFLITLPMAIIFSMFSRGAMNEKNVARYGKKADYRTNPTMAVLGSFTGGVLWAVIITVIIDLL